MNRDDYQQDLIDLGTATEETKGAALGIFDQEGTLYRPAALTDD